MAVCRIAAAWMRDGIRPARHFRELRDVSPAGADQDRGMVISIRIGRGVPLEGEIAAEGEAPVVFGGWLGLLRLLSDIVSRLDTGVSPGDHRGELDAGGDADLPQDVRQVRLDGPARDE